MNSTETPLKPAHHDYLFIILYYLLSEPQSGVSGGAEGNRTPVRKQLGKNFSGRSLLFTFPYPGGNKHSTGFGSFIMHGTRKA